MYGNEIEEIPAEIAQLSLWLADHQMNQELSDIVGQLRSNIPLVDSPHIIHGNALVLEWEKVAPKLELSYILGNPPFVAKQDRNLEQRKDVENMFGKLKGAGELDYVSCWYVKAVRYIKGTDISCAFVSTNSITQGEQASILWPELMRLGVHINFAHRTFKWTNEAQGNAGVYCVIVGFSLVDNTPKRLFDYEAVSGDPHEIKAKKINAYLIDGPDIVITSRRKPIADVPIPSFGSMPNDNGLLLFTDNKEKDE